MRKYPKIEKDDFFDYRFVRFKFLKFKDIKKPKDFKCDKLLILYQYSVFGNGVEEDKRVNNYCREKNKENILF